ncbi:MAG TPA: hypothetical protein VFH48_46095 [Chloroflexota bacterium]|nr:hypothetical protein [Chloroflexota bacterium]
MLSETTRRILGHIAEGRSYDQILQQHPELTYFAIFAAAREALELAQLTPSRLSTVETRPVDVLPHAEPPLDDFSELTVERPAPTPVPKRLSFVERARATHGRAFTRWSRDEDARLETLFRAGTPRPEIARQLDRHDGAVIRRLEKLGLIEAPDRPASRAHRDNRHSRARQTAKPDAEEASTAQPAVPGWDVFRQRLSDEPDTR